MAQHRKNGVGMDLLTATVAVFVNLDRRLNGEQEWRRGCHRSHLFLLNRKGGVDLVQDGISPLMFHVDVQPSPFQLADILVLKPVEEHRSPKLGFSSFLRRIKMVDHPASDVHSLTEVENQVPECC